MVEDIEKIAGRQRPSEAERKIAARVVLKANNALGRPTPKWVRKLAEK